MPQTSGRHWVDLTGKRPRRTHSGMTTMTRATLILLAAAFAVASHGTAMADSFGILRLRIGAVESSQFRPLSGRLEPFRVYLADHLEIPVEIQTFRNGADLVEAAAHRRIDYALFSGATYAAAWRSCGCMEPLAAPKSIDGTAGVRAILVVRGDSPYRTLDDLKGKVLAASNPRSIAGRLVPFNEMASEGSDPNTLFQRIETAAGPEAAVLQMIDRKVDAALAWSTLEGEADEGYDRGALHALVGRHLLDMHQIRIIWRSGLIPNGPHAVRDDLPLSLKNRLRDILLDLIDNAPEAYDAVEPDFGGGFVPIGHSTYLPLLRLVTPPGQDPMQAPVPRAQAGKN
jgi:phosphonate transport system substrate-binding protein